jgi:hypothetical protein
MVMMMRFFISISSPNAGIFANQLGAGLQAYLAYAAVPVGGEEEVHGGLRNWRAATCCLLQRPPERFDGWIPLTKFSSGQSGYGMVVMGYQKCRPGSQP